ncbi:MAG TPA: acetyl-CoA carboxylase biotin carboxyl carrier protein [Kofleriaceae bacterium]|jgi:acetyl-CoA carboxylase biotin carboxyl carrier protein
MARGKSKEIEHDHEEDETVVDLARGLAEIVSEHNLSELVLDTKEVKLTIRKGGIAAPIVAAPAPVVHHAPAVHHHAPAGPAPAAPAAPVDDKSHTITSPFVGTFYRKPNPDSPNYVAVNEQVDKGQVLCIVEAMKLMNEIESDIAGTVVSILVEDGSPVEYGQALFKIKP